MECSSRNSSFHPDEYHINSCINKPHTNKLHPDKPQPTHTRKYSSHADKLVHTDKFVQGDKNFDTLKISQAVKTPSHHVKT